MVTKKLNPLEVGKPTTNYLYVKVLLGWELEFSNTKFDVRLGSFREFCDTKSVIVEQGRNPKDFDRKVSQFYGPKNKIRMYFVYRKYDSKAKSLLYHLRNATAHADFGRIKIGRRIFICFQHSHQGKLKMMGQIPESLLPEFIDALASTKK